MSEIARSPVMLSVLQASEYLDISSRTVKRQCQSGELKTETVIDNGGPQYRIHLSSLSQEAQAKYWIGVYHDTFLPTSTREEKYFWLKSLNLDPTGIAFDRVYKATGLHISPEAWSDEVSEKRHGDLFQMKTFAKETARERAQLVRGFVAARRRAPEGMKTQAGREYAEIEGICLATLNAWLKQVKHLQQKDWEPALVPGWKGGRKKVDIHPEVWNFLECTYMVNAQPNAKSVYYRACRLAKAKGWPIPSYRIVLARLNALDRPLRVLMREGKSAFDALYPGITRDWSTLALHEVWNADGRKADVMCIWPDGYVGRPITLQWLDLRSRYPLGVDFGKGENVDLVRTSYRNAVDHAGCMPHEAYLDNGAAFASKQFTGGQTKRNRFKVKETEITGILTLMGVKAIWATPARGQVKPIESFWNTIAENVDKHFGAAYCGKDTVSRPEGSNPIKHPIPIADYIAAYMVEIEAYKQRLHRGIGMGGMSPMQVYTEEQANTISRVATTDQKAWMHLVSETVMLNKKDRSFVINGNVYWDAKLAMLESTGPYTARYDGDDSRVPVQLFNGLTFVCAADLRLRTGARNLAAAKDGIRAKKQEKRAIKDREKAIKDQRKAASWTIDALPAAPGTGDTPAAPAAKVIAPLRPAKNYKPVMPPIERATPEQLAQMRLNEKVNLAAREAKLAESGFIKMPRQAGGMW